MLGAERAMRAELGSVTLADLASRVEGKSPRFVGIDVPSWFAMRYSSRRAPASEPSGAEAGP